MVKKLQSPAEKRGFSDGSSRDVGYGGDCSEKSSDVKYGVFLLKAQVEGSSNKDQKLDNKLKRPNDLQLFPIFFAVTII
ncbi:hypothetical protein MKW98_021636 [Papaver atlanticum]|uniref:Uncharacterized protein n=1 Tax=Papaver atlanticum TaxID=357466 RepID=A0AAD4XVA9_9MAGN|nr:hypothetical protein MKW98_021636 [Papaver atlanticum]